MKHLSNRNLKPESHKTMSDCIKFDFINDFRQVGDLNRLKKTNAKLGIISTIHKNPI